MVSKERFNNDVIPYLQRISVLPEKLLHSNEKEFFSDLYAICSNKKNTEWQQQSFMFDKYAIENLDFKYLIMNASSAMSDVSNLPDSALLFELINVAHDFLIKITPNMPDNIKRLTSEFIVNKSAFYSYLPIIRLPWDACASNWEEYPLPLFDWPWPGLERELTAHKNCLPELYRAHMLTAFGDKNLSEWKSRIWEKPDCYWLETEKMQELRKIQKQYAIRPARTKKDLVSAITEIKPLPIEAQDIVNKERNWPLSLIKKEKAARQLPLSELYKPHLVRLLQTRVDSYYSAIYGYNSPLKRQKENKLYDLEVTLEIDQTCKLCGSEKKEITYQELKSLPPYHIICTCPLPRWKADFSSTLSNDPSDNSYLDKAINKFVKNNIHETGLGLNLPTKSQLLRFRYAEKKDRLVNNIRCFLEKFKTNS